MEAKTTTLDENSPVLNLYEWYWGADKFNTNFCKLFWAGIFGLLLLPFRILLIPVLWITTPIVNRINNYIVRKEKERLARIRNISIEDYLKQKEIKREKKRQRQARWQKVGDFFNNILLKLQWNWIWLKWVFVAASIALVGAIIYSIFLWPEFYLNALIIIGIVAGIVVGTILIVIPIIWVLDKNEHRIKNGWSDFRNATSNGYHSVKTATCPVIEVRKNHNG